MSVQFLCSTKKALSWCPTSAIASVRPQCVGIHPHSHRWAIAHAEIVRARVALPKFITHGPCPKGMLKKELTHECIIKDLPELSNPPHLARQWLCLRDAISYHSTFIWLTRVSCAAERCSRQSPKFGRSQNKLARAPSSHCQYLQTCSVHAFRSSTVLALRLNTTLATAPPPVKKSIIARSEDYKADS